MPDDPDFLLFGRGNQGFNSVYSVEYKPSIGQPFHAHPFHTLPGVYAHNAPCAVCLATSRCSLLMIPAKTSCPAQWTTEYIGYIMSGDQNHSLPTEYMCVLIKIQSQSLDSMIPTGSKDQEYLFMLKLPAMAWPVLHMMMRRCSLVLYVLDE